jgi:hypothetical protein
MTADVTVPDPKTECFDDEGSWRMGALDPCGDFPFRRYSDVAMSSAILAGATAGSRRCSIGYVSQRTLGEGFGNVELRLRKYDLSCFQEPLPTVLFDPLAGPAEPGFFGWETWERAKPYLIKETYIKIQGFALPR